MAHWEAWLLALHSWASVGSNAQPPLSFSDFVCPCSCSEWRIWAQASSHSWDYSCSDIPPHFQYASILMPLTSVIFRACLVWSHTLPNITQTSMASVWLQPQLWRATFSITYPLVIESFAGQLCHKFGDPFVRHKNCGMHTCGMHTCGTQVWQSVEGNQTCPGSSSAPNQHSISIVYLQCPPP